LPIFEKKEKKNPYKDKEGLWNVPIIFFLFLFTLLTPPILLKVG